VRYEVESGHFNFNKLEKVFGETAAAETKPFPTILVATPSASMVFASLGC
jgi:hypothetical protein